MNNDSNKKKILMKSAVAFSFALAMFGANAGADVSAEEAMTTGKAGFNSTFDDNEEDGDVRQGNEADNGDDTKGITTNMEESASKASAVNSVLGAANGYNVFVKGNYSVNGADISSNGQLGNLAAGGNVSVPGNYTAGKVVVGGEVSGSFLNGTSDESIDFDEAFNQLTATSNSLANLEANGDIVANRYWGQISFNGSDPDLNVFTITVDEYNAMRAAYPDTLSFDFNVPAGSHCIVNIVGEGSVDLSVNAGATYAKESISNGTDNNRNILFNVPDAESVTIRDNMGALMAVNANVKSADGVSGNHFEGSLICNSYEGGNEFGANSYDESVIVNKVTPPTSSEEDTPDDKEDEKPEDNGDETPDPEPTPDPTPDSEPTPDVPYNPYETIETFDEPEEEPEVEAPVAEEIPEIVEFEETAVPLSATPFEEESSEADEVFEETRVTDFDTFETFDDTPVPLADDPFGDADSATDNPKTGEDLTVPAVSAAAAMAAFLTILYANKKKREEAQG